MENLVRNISRLLSRHNCVIIPTVGAFLAHNVPASYNEKEQLFVPPHRMLGFNPHVTVDDALLLSEYVSTCNTSYEDASKALSRDIASLRRKPESESICCFGELGTFHMNINGVISFVPAENAIEDPYNFGFEPLSVPLLSQCKEKVIRIKRHDFSRYVAIAAAVILAFFFVAPVSDSAYEESLQASLARILPAESDKPAIEIQETEITAEQENIDGNAGLYTIAPVEDTITENIITGKQPETEAIGQPSLAEEDAAPQKIYSIIVASSPNADNAQLAIKELTRKSKADYTVVVGGGRHRVSTGDYDNAEEANKALITVKETFPDAWVLVH